MREIAWRVDRYIQRHPQQERQWIEEKRHQDSQRDSIDLHLEYTQVRSGNQPNDDAHRQQFSDNEIDRIAAEEVPILVLEECVATRASLPECKPSHK